MVFYEQARPIKLKHNFIVFVSCKMKIVFFVRMFPSNCLLLPCPDNADNAGWGKFAKSSLWFHRSCNFGWKLVYIFRYKPDWCGNKLWQVSPYKQHPSEEAGARFVPSVEPTFCAHKYHTIPMQTLFAHTNTLQYKYKYFLPTQIPYNTNTNTFCAHKYTTVQIQILFAHTNTLQYKYKYFLPTQIRKNTNANTFCAHNYTTIQIQTLFAHTNTNTFCPHKYATIQIQNWSPRMLAADSHGETSFMQQEKFSRMLKC